MNTIRPLLSKLLAVFVIAASSNLASAQFAFTQAGPALDLEAFHDEVEQAFDGNCVGYAVAVYRNGAYLPAASVAGGHAIRPGDAEAGVPVNQLPFRTRTRMGIASCSKTITALTVMRMLEVQGLDADDEIHPYFPSDWDVHPSFMDLTFADVLRHRTGFQRFTPQFPDTPAGKYLSLKMTIESGGDPNQLQTDGSYSHNYSNLNYAMCRVLIPYLFWPALMQTYEDNPTLAFHRGHEVSLAMARVHVFQRAGVSTEIDTVDWHPNGQTWRCAKLYRFEQNAANYASGRRNDEGFFGPGSLVMNARELSQIISAFELGLIVSPSVRDEMKSRRLGMGRTNQSGYAFYSHSGAASQGSRGLQTVWISCPYNYQVAVLINSKNNSYSPRRAKIIRDAFINALD